jgi:hypothetical protein
MRGVEVSMSRGGAKKPGNRAIIRKFRLKSRGLPSRASMVHIRDVFGHKYSFGQVGPKKLKPLLEHILKHDEAQLTYRGQLTDTKHHYG